MPRQALWRYVTLHRNQEPGPLFLSERRGGMLRTSLTQLLTKLARKTAWPDKTCHPHMFRRTFAVEFIGNGGGPFRLQMFLGHSTPAMLRRCTATCDAEKTAQAHALFGPADRLNGRLPEGGNGSERAFALQAHCRGCRCQSVIRIQTLDG